MLGVFYFHCKYDYLQPAKIFAFFAPNVRQMRYK